jgi:hypothetical protein
MYSLKQLIEQGQYELAAHRLVLGVVQAHLEQRPGADASASVGGPEDTEYAGHVAHMEAVSDG